MRLDKFLKTSRIIKRRTVANSIANNGRAKVNGKPAKPSLQIEKGDRIEIQFGSGNVLVEVMDVREHVNKKDVAELYRIIGDTTGEEDNGSISE